MTRKIRSAVGQILLFTTSTVVGFIIIVSTDLVSHFSYLMEKGRIQAVREALPSEKDLDLWNGRARAVASVVSPAVVQIIAERQWRAEDQDQLDILQKLFNPKDTLPECGDDDADLKDDRDGEQKDSTDNLESILKNHPFDLAPSMGSGFVVDAGNGYIVTNSHVVEDCKAIRAYLADGRRFSATVVGLDPKSDIAVIQIPAENLHELSLADSSQVQVGDDVMAVGNPFGLDGTFSRGIISAKQRSNINIHGTEYKGFLQTDAVINPGNSGGPLVNMRGEVIAMNTAIATQSGHYDGVGFAIPTSRIKQVIPALIAGETVQRGYLGVSIVSATAFEPLSKELGWEEPHGVIIRKVMPDSPAEKGGLKVEDIVIDINGRKLRGTADLIDIVGAVSPGETIAISLWRSGIAEKVELKVGKQPKNFSTRIPLDR